MRALPLRSAAVLALAGAAAALPGSRTIERPPPGYSGGFGEASCVTCHVGNEINAFGGRVYLTGLPERYEQEGEYVLSVVLEADETEIAGFQVTARFADGPQRGRSAGRLVPVDARTAVTDSAGVSYLHQSRAGSATSDRSGSSWSFAWTAPGSAHAVLFNVAANSGNADESPLGDLVYTHEATAHPAERSPSSGPERLAPRR